MFSDNQKTVAQVSNKTTGLFTTQPLAWKSNNAAPVKNSYAQQVPHATAGMDMFTKNQARINPMQMSMAPRGAPQSFGGSASSFFAPAPPSRSGYAQMAATSAMTPKMLGSQIQGKSGQNQRTTAPTMMAGLGHSVNMQNHGRSSYTIMQAGATATAPDKVALQQKYDNTDHLDPVLHYTGNKYVQELMENAKKLSAPGKGILASDESNGTCGKRFEAIGVENTEQNRNDYRELLYTTKDLENSISGAIMYDETIRQSTAAGVPFTKVLGDRGILTGIKVDTGISIIEGTNDELVTNGLDGLSQRVAEYYEMGARFAKWRAVLRISEDGCPSDVSITETAHSLARYAQICQHGGLVPIVEPEILTDGEHDIKTCARVSEKVFNAVMNELITQKICLEGMLLKPNMITSGAQAKEQAGPEEVAFFTVRTLARTIPPAVPGITFLSGGQSEEVASLNLNAINKLADVKHPWTMTFSFGRALQSSVLDTWKGKKENVEAAQKMLYDRCEASANAAKGKYEGGQGSTASDYVANYVY